MKHQPELLDEETYLLTAVADDPRYGYSETHPIPVGGDERMEGPLNERRVLNALLGPQGEMVYFERRGSFRAFNIQNCRKKEAILDAYEVLWEGLEEPKVLYFNMYEYGEIMAPAGFTCRTKTFCLEELAGPDEEEDDFDIDSLLSDLEDTD